MRRTGGDYDRLLFSVMAPEKAVVRIIAATDRDIRQLDGPPAAANKQELALDLGGARRRMAAAAKRGFLLQFLKTRTGLSWKLSSGSPWEICKTRLPRTNNFYEFLADFRVALRLWVNCGEEPHEHRPRGKRAIG